ncbi:hypothetical protein ACVDG3_21965 [Meridianimarinicoccus sp. RP-17]
MLASGSVFSDAHTQVIVEWSLVVLARFSDHVVPAVGQERHL